MIITIDGYAGSGKSTAAEQLAAALNFDLLNTGAMYRAAGLALQDRGIDIYAGPRDVAAITALVNTFTFAMPSGKVFLNGADYTGRVRDRGAGGAASKVGTFREVRERLKAEQRRIAAGRDVICEGRDQGTAVFPDAPVKFFFTASPEVRAERRLAQLLADNKSADYDEILRNIKIRDHQDETREVDPLRKADDAVVIDTSHTGADAVLALMLKVVAACRARG
jgi:cytidylate kinase